MFPWANSAENIPKRSAGEVESGANVYWLRGGNNSRILCAHPYRPVAFRQVKKFPGTGKVLPGKVWLDRKAGVVLLCWGRLCRTKYGYVGASGEERVPLVHIDIM